VEKYCIIKNEPLIRLHILNIDPIQSNRMTPHTTLYDGPDESSLAMLVPLELIIPILWLTCSLEETTSSLKKFK
jgi:hypothetical protein